VSEAKSVLLLSEVEGREGKTRSNKRLYHKQAQGENEKKEGKND
jgi:hypothetical protein